MSTILLNNFDGIYPRISDTGLPDNAGTVATNVKLTSGEIRPWKKPVAVQATIQSGVTSIFKLEGANGGSIWCEWVEDTDVCYSPLADESEYRIYYSQGGVCKKSNYAMASASTAEGREAAPPYTWLHMGVPHPTVKLTVTATRVPNDPDKWEEDHPDDPYEEYSADNTDNRVYVYTYVSQFGDLEEESAPSDPTEVVCDTVGGEVHISGFGNPPTDHYNITKIRLYRAVTGSSTTVYMLVDEFNLVNHQFPESGRSLNGVDWENSTYDDTRLVTQLGKSLDSLYYDPPPEGLRGLVSMPNGFLAGFVHNQVWFSEPYLPHAWPSNYMLTTDSPIVGLGVYGNTLVVATTRQPYTISGTHPAAMTQDKQPMIQPCVSKRSIAYDQHGVLYASAYGLVIIAGGQMDIFTRPIITQDEWQDYNPATITAIMYNNLYMAAYRRAQGNGILVFARSDTPALTNYKFTPTAMHVERATGRLYCLQESDSTIYRMDSDPINAEVYEWVSKRFVNPYWTGFSAMKLDAEFNANENYDYYMELREEVLANNAAIWDAYENDSILGDFNSCMPNTVQVNGDLLEDIPTFPEYRTVTVTLIADGEEIYTRSFDSIQAVRIPPVRAHDWQIRLAGNMQIRSFSMATTMAELARPN